MKRFQFTLCLFILIPPFAVAQDKEIGLSTGFEKCMDKAVSTVDMIDCMTKENTSQDKRLNRAYKSLMETLSAERKKKLQEAQRAWIKYRDANCDYYYDPDGGSMARIAANNCVLDATASRAQELENFLALLRLVWARGQTPWTPVATAEVPLSLKGETGRWVS